MASARLAGSPQSLRSELRQVARLCWHCNSDEEGGKVHDDKRRWTAANERSACVATACMCSEDALACSLRLSARTLPLACC